jgi:hypothetical protein
MQHGKDNDKGTGGRIIVFFEKNGVEKTAISDYNQKSMR